VDDRRRGEPGLDVADAAVDLEQDVALGLADEGVDALVVEHRRPGPHRLLGVEDRRQDLVLDRQPAGSPSSAAASLSASTTATRCPTKRATLSSM
jgi:hypothetical protein